MTFVPTYLTDLADRAGGVLLWRSLLLLAAAMGLSLLAHRLVYAIVLPHQAPDDALRSRFLRRARRPLRLAAMLVGIAMVAPALTLSPGIANALRHAVLVAIIVLVGWSVLVLVDIMTAHSMRRYRIDTADNLMARKYLTQLRILKRAVAIVTVLLTVAAVLMTFDGVRRYGVSLFASAGAAGLVVGLAARPVLANLIAGIQIALTQPIRLDDVVIVEGEWGWIEEIFATYVVVRIWDLRRMVIPLSYFIEQPFQNWTRENAQIMGSVFWYVDYTMPVDEVRAEVERVIAASSRWDGKVKGLQVTDTDKDVMTLRGVMTSRDAPTNWDLRCEVREKVLAWMQKTHPDSLPRLRAEIGAQGGSGGRPATGAGGAEG